MKIVLFLLLIAFIGSCSDPIRLTTPSNNGAITSGTLGSARAENQTPVRPTDSLRIRDSLKH